MELRIGSETIRTNRALISATSLVFERMLNSHMSESTSKEVSLQQFAFKPFAQVLDCVFCGKLEITPQNVAEYLAIAHFYEFRCVTQKCEQWILHHKEQIELDTLYDLADKYSLTEVKNVLVKDYLQLCREGKPVDQQKFELLLRDVTVLDLHKANDLPALYHGLLVHCKNLKHLNLSKCNWVSGKKLEQLAHLTELESLNLH